MNSRVGSVTISTPRPAVSRKKIPAQSQVAPWKKRCRPGVMPGLAQGHHLGGEPGHQWAGPARGPREEHAHDQIGDRELEQVKPELAGGEHDGGLQGEHRRRDREQAGDAAGRDLADQRGEPGGDQAGQQADVTAVEPGPEGGGAQRQAGGFGQAPERCAQQQQRPRQLQVLSHGGEPKWSRRRRAPESGRVTMNPFIRVRRPDHHADAIHKNPCHSGGRRRPQCPSGSHIQ